LVYAKKASETLDFIERMVKYLEKLRHFKPDVKSLIVNYLDRSTELKLLLNVPLGIRRNYRNIKIPAYEGYEIAEIFDAETLNKQNLEWKKEKNYWIAKPHNLPVSENYFVIMKGAIAQEALDLLVKLYCPEDPKRTFDLDYYWIDSAIKDMSILEKIYKELTIDKVDTCINVELDRQFTSQIPKEIENYFRARAQADIWLETKDRQKSFKSFYNLRLARRKMGKISPQDVYKIGKKVVNPENFFYFLSVDKPFRISGLVNVDDRHIIPEKIGVRVQTDLNYRQPTAQGDLVFKKIEFGNKVKEEFESLLPENE